MKALSAYDILPKGTQHNNWTILEFIKDSYIKNSSSSERNKQKYKVQCTCGNITILSRKRFQYSKYHSCRKCACTYKSILDVGDTFGRLKVLKVDESSILESNKDTPYIWKYLCICKCGNKVSVLRSSLVNGDTLSCGCLSSETISKRLAKSNIFKFEDANTVRVFFYNREASFLIDKEDWEQAKYLCWYWTKKAVRAKIKGTKQDISLHRFLLNVPEDCVVDHKDGNILNNKRSNLRKSTPAQNSYNKKVSVYSKSGVSGVRLQANGKYTVTLTKNRKQMYFGSYTSFEEAVSVRHEAEIKYFGEYSPMDSRNLISN